MRRLTTEVFMNRYDGKYLCLSFATDPPTEDERALLGKAVADWPAGEALWVQIFDFEGDYLICTVDDQPLATKEVHFGSVIRVLRSEAKGKLRARKHEPRRRVQPPN